MEASWLDFIGCKCFHTSLWSGDKDRFCYSRMSKYSAEIIPKLLSQAGPGGDNEKLADLLAGVADHLCQVFFVFVFVFHVYLWICLLLCLFCWSGRPSPPVSSSIDSKLLLLPELDFHYHGVECGYSQAHMGHFPQDGENEQNVSSFFWSFTVIKRFDFFKFSQLFWRDYVRC